MQERGQWGSRLGFILASAGSAVGLGNLWKFPYLAHQNHGGAFVLVYLGAVLLVGFPIMVAEIVMGRRARRNPVGSFALLATGRPGGKAWTAVGFLGVVTGFIILSYYSVVAGWTFHYIVLSLRGELGALASEPGALQVYFGQIFLGDGVQQAGYHLAFMAVTVGAVYFGVKGGIERVSLVLMPALFAILLALVIYAMTTSGFRPALAFLFRPSFAELQPSAILAAVGQAFFSLSLGMGCMLTYGSYMKREDSIPRSVLEICCLDTLVGVLACVVMFSIVFTFDLKVTQSATILFTTLPTLLVQLPLGDLANGLFFVLVAFAALTSTVSMLEVVSSYAIDELGWSRRRATLTMGVAIAVFGLLSALSLGGVPALSRVNLFGRSSTAGVFSSLDYLAANWLLPVGGLLIALFVGWFLDPRDTRDELETGRARLGRSFGLLRFVLRFVSPLAVGAILFSIIFLGREYQ
ncbi:MAG TPA: sodium-dependent transporter [Candidatus Krumholzibacteria bacterium]|nr:sodium-dependent transporter [Candidatus Krumholzibacteria bacterium]HPD71185.1 sodium-dependent transporter [Candidatus Krumholzibacteria bacterium]HRY39115.1 sodium-dependent transporter [Candidatus Krumholzibacteria bacterium]